MFAEIVISDTVLGILSASATGALGGLFAILKAFASWYDKRQNEYVQENKRVFDELIKTDHRRLELLNAFQADLTKKANELERIRGAIERMENAIEFFRTATELGSLTVERKTAGES